ncbi:glycogen synthase GlgA [candidate division KSB1 bacterium]|nr:glycogen synthase GlgA [bacterium]RKY93119.1 MAG: glycogen synthase GlgA [candidate division KSB1 bacterium]
MVTPCSVFFLSSEIAPFAKTGGLADVAGSLPKALKELGHEIRLFMPRYRCINERKFILRDVIRLKNLEIPLGNKKVKVDIKSSFIPNTKVQVYFLDYKPYFDRNELYVDPVTKTDYKDNDERFILFTRTALEMLKLLHWQPDIIHCNDWQTGLIPLYLKTIYSEDEFFRNVKTLFTIHNIGYQGNFDKSAVSKANLPESLFYPLSPIEFYGKFSFLKAGLEYADKINTVSPTYAQEIQQGPEYGHGMEGILRRRRKDLHGILNGVDYSEWSPDVDKYIPFQYDSNQLDKKLENKKALLEECKLSFDEGTPLIGSISRLADQKGFDLIAEIIDKVMKLDLHYLLLGTGDQKYHRLFNKIAKKYPQKISVQLKFDNRLAHLIEAGSDMFLMPSKYEPCGLNQLYSLRYGTIPIVRATGGLADTVVDFNPETKTGTGFVFKNYDSAELLQAIKRAIDVFADKPTWTQLVRTAMEQDFSWKTSAKEYTKLYALLLNSQKT